jgi:hypothetical protein
MTSQREESLPPADLAVASALKIRVAKIAASNGAGRIIGAVPGYRSETILGLPSTRAISRRYQYVFPLIFFGYRLAMRLGHTLDDDQVKHRDGVSSGNTRQARP